jgi:hypothetical protein
VGHPSLDHSGHYASLTAHGLLKFQILSSPLGCWFGSPRDDPFSRQQPFLFDVFYRYQYNRDMIHMVKKSEDLLTVSAAAAEVGVTPGRIRQLIGDSTIKSRKLGPRIILVDRKSLESYFSRPQTTGRPRKGS